VATSASISGRGSTSAADGEPRSSLLVVDDSEANRDALSRHLRRLGYLVTGAEDGLKALDWLARQPFDLVLLDVMMPEIDGLEVLRRVRQTHPPEILPIIMATANDASGDVVRALDLGANDYVTKPLDFPVVAARVRTQLELRRSVERIRQLQEASATRAHQSRRRAGIVASFRRTADRPGRHLRIRRRLARAGRPAIYLFGRGHRGDGRRRRVVRRRPDVAIAGAVGSGRLAHKR
jgi:DNA-binding response OmpR family regulator